MNRAIVFDVDGTLAETEEMHRLAFNRAFAAAGLDWCWDEETYGALLGTTGGRERIMAYARKVGADFVDDVEAFAARLHAEKTAVYVSLIEQAPVPLRPGIRDLVDDARAAGLTLAVATTTSAANVDGLLTSAFGADWRTIFPVVTTGEMVAAKKPAPDLYLLALERLGIDASRAVALEDSRNGVAAARAAGLPVAAVRSLYLAGDDLGAADRIYGCPSEIRLDDLLALIGTGAPDGA
jgi:HAD superfamily hydrolase (TIGR01509 family)